MATTAMIVEEKSRFSRLILSEKHRACQAQAYTGDHDDCEQTEVLNQLENAFSARGLLEEPRLARSI